MAIEGVYRYNELIDNIITGDFYASGGIVIPYRSERTTMRLETESPNTEYGIYLNDSYSGTVVSDAEGNVTFEKHLELGEIKIDLFNNISGRKITSWVTTRNYAVWLSAYAEIFEYIDDNIEETQNDLSINTVTLNGVEDHFGEAISTYNNLGQDLNAFKQMVHELRLGYRNYGSRFRGLEVAISAFTQVPPFGYSHRMWGPNWVLDQSMIMNHRFDERSHELSTTGNITGITLEKVESDCFPSASHRLHYNATTNELKWEPYVTLTPGVPIKAVDGEIFLPGREGENPAHILGQAGTFNIVVSTNDTLYMDVDNKGTIAITITAGAAVPVATVITDINNAMVADARYGASYSAFASLYNSKLLLESPSVIDSIIRLEDGADNVVADLIGLRSGDLTFNPSIIDGIRIKKVNNLSILGGTATLQYEYNGSVTPATKRIRWRSGAAVGWSGWTSVTESGDYIITDAAAVDLYVGCLFDIMEELVPAWPAVNSQTFSIGYSRTETYIKRRQGLWVYCDTSLLPGAGTTTDAITVIDDSTLGFDDTPDNWWIERPSSVTSSTILASSVITSRIDPLDPAPAYSWYIDDAVAAGSVIEVRTHVKNWPMPRPGPRGSNFPQRSNGLFYDYEGFKAKLSGWFRNFRILGVAAGTTNVTLGFSFDNGATWVNGTPTAIVEEVGTSGYEHKTYVEFETIIKHDSTPIGNMDNNVLARVVFSKVATGLVVELDAMNVEIGLISSRYLNNVTVSRSRHRQYFGEIIWLWSTTPLTLIEKEYIGLKHKKPSIVSPISGVTITTVSNDTPAGAGTIEYEYNSLGDTHRLRWKSYNDSYGSWVPIISSTSYNLASLNGSSITIEANITILPVLSGTPPATTTTRNITISDTTVNQGHSRRISAANSSIDLVDVTEYDSNDNPTNLFGAITESDFSFCGLINVDIKSSDPFKDSYIFPEFLPVEGETLSFSAFGPNWVASLDYYSDEDQIEAILFEDGIALPNDNWNFSAANEVTITSGYTAGAVYTIDYNLLYQVTSSFMDLSSYSPSEHIYFADYFLWDRMDKVLGEYSNTVSLFFNQNNGRAVLRKQSNKNMADSTLTMQDGINSTVISKRYWRYIDSKTVELDLSQYRENAQYTLEYMENKVYESSRLSVTFEHRSGTSYSNTDAAAWVQIERNENVRNDHNFHQLRISITGIRDLSDFKLRSLVLKGLHVWGTPNVPGLTGPLT